jgi:hypothetical protein
MPALDVAHHVLDVDTATNEARTLAHHFQQSVFAGCADDRDSLEVHN